MVALFSSSTLFVLILLSTKQIGDVESKPLLQIYYECLNDVARSFFLKQFQLAYSSDLISEIDLRIYPYGNTQNQDGVYTCPYGTLQCEANKVHVCMIGQTSDKSIIASFVNCFFKNRHQLSSVEDLAKQCVPTGYWNSFQSCLGGTDWDIFKGVEIETIYVADQIKEDGLVALVEKGDAKQNLVEKICEELGKTDGVCAQQSPPKLPIGIYCEAANMDSSTFLTKQLSAHYHVLEDLVELEIIPHGDTQFTEIPDGTGVYECSGGEMQCISNKFQALVMDFYVNSKNISNGELIPKPTIALNFIRCLTQRSNSIQSLETCSNENLDRLDYGTFIEYIKTNSPKVESVMEVMRNKTRDTVPNGSKIQFPLVTINGEISLTGSENLVQEVCAHYPDYLKPEICTQVNLTVIYEPMNHLSRSWIQEQLAPLYREMFSLINLHLNPAGRAVELVDPNGSKWIECPAGEDQCSAAKLHACALELFWNTPSPIITKPRIFDFIWCVTKNKRTLSVADSGKSCAGSFLDSVGSEEFADSWNVIYECYTNGTGDGILADYIQKRIAVDENVNQFLDPVVLINGIRVADLATVPIGTHVCAFYDDYNKPDYCSSSNPIEFNRIPIRVFYETQSELSKRFFGSQLGPWFSTIQEMVNIQLLPAGNTVGSNECGTCEDQGQDPCTFNKLQSVILDRYSTRDDQNDSLDGTYRTVLFLKCVSGLRSNWNSNISQVYESCSRETLPFDVWSKILQTADSPDGATVYKKVLDSTKQFLLNNQMESFPEIPWMSIGKLQGSRMAVEDLLQSVCNQYESVSKPLECIPVEIQIYYSAFNPESRRFFLDQLVPVFRNMRSTIHLELIPYGVVIDPDLTLEEECSKKDPKICEANLVHACIISYYQNIPDTQILYDEQNRTLTFVYCMLKNVNNFDLENLTLTCVNETLTSPTEVIQECLYNEDNTSKYLERMRNLTIEQFHTMTQSPWIVLNGLRSSEAEFLLKESICDLIQGDQPPYCLNPTPEKVKIQFHYSSHDSNSRDFMIHQLYPNFRLLEEIIELDPVPFGTTEIIPHDDVENNTLICAKGMNECIDNMIHACLYDRFYSLDQKLQESNRKEPEFPTQEFDRKVLFIEFLNCYFNDQEYNFWNNENSAQSCTESLFGPDVWSSVNECARTRNGIQLLLKMQSKVSALRPQLSKLPLITINGLHSTEIVHNPNRTLCDAFRSREKPEQCTRSIESEAKPKLVVHYEPGNVNSRQFFTSGFDPELVCSIADIQLVPFDRSNWNNQTMKSCSDQDDTCSQYLLHTCMIQLYYSTNPIPILRTIVCTFGTLINDPNVVNKCVNQFLTPVTNDAWKQIINCSKNQTQRNQVVQTQTISHVPWILINGKVNTRAEEALTNELCSVYYRLDRPEGCEPELLGVKIYYETLNPKVNSLFLEQLSQYGQYLDRFGHFSFVPYGSSTWNSNGTFSCSNGQLQCDANRIHACILSRSWNKQNLSWNWIQKQNRNRFAKFLECSSLLEQNDFLDPVLNSEGCSKKVFGSSLDYSEITSCFTGQEGDKLYQEMSDLTGILNPKLTSAPVVTIGPTNESNSDALINLFQFLCNSYSTVAPSICSTLPNLGVKVGVYFSANTHAQTYFREQMAPFYKDQPDNKIKSETRLQDLLVPDLTAWGNTVYDPENTTHPFICNEVNECYINRFFACIHHYHGNEPRASLYIIKFALCFFNTPDSLINPTSALHTCSNQIWFVQDPFLEQVESCATEQTQQSFDIYLEMRDKTQNNYPVLTTFPAITIENRLNLKATLDLLGTVCGYYKGYDLPPECTQTSTSPPPNSTSLIPNTQQTTTTTDELISSTQPSTNITVQPSPKPTKLNKTKLIACILLLISILTRRVRI